MTLVQRNAPSHWYLRDGTPFHEIAKKDGSGNRPVTLADARKVMALPSVTNVLNVLAKPGLDAWKIEQGIMAALTLPRVADEPLDAFAHRVVADMGEQVEKAADFGTAIHTACEVYARTKELATDPKLLPHLKEWVRWFDQNVERISALETVYVNHEHGYAGRVDMVALVRGIGWCVVDFKTQKVKRSAKGDPKPAFYETWPLQLAAYQQAILANSAKGISALLSVVIDSAQPGPVHIMRWNAADYFRPFKAAFTLWKYVKQYDPASVGSVEGCSLRVEGSEAQGAGVRSQDSADSGQHSDVGGQVSGISRGECQTPARRSATCATQGVAAATPYPPSPEASARQAQPSQEATARQATAGSESRPYQAGLRGEWAVGCGAPQEARR